MQPTQFENTFGRVFRTIRFEKNEKIKKKYCLKNHQKNHFSIFVKYILRVHWDCLLALDLEDHSWDDGSRHAEVCHIHSQPPSHVLYLWKGNYQFKKNIVFVFSYLFCTCQLYFFRQTNQPRQLWWYCTRHKCSREHIGNLYLHILNIVSPEAHQTRSQPLTAKKRKL